MSFKIKMSLDQRP